QHMEHQALHDDLTSLPNRAYLQKQIPVYISACRRHGRRGAVILLDLDGFKLVNDSLGHEAGDELLKCIGQRLVNDIRKEDFVARLGGDEFVVVLSDISDDADTAIEQINQVLESLLENIAKPVKLEDTDVRVTSSIGVVFFPDRYDNYETIMKNVDSAMYKAKELGGNRGNLFDLEMQQLMVIKTQVLRGIKDAIHSDQLRVYYQPQVNDKGEFIGAEALVRWMHPQQGLLPPQKFIHVIENNSLVIDLSHWVLKTVCLQYRHLCECYGSSDNFSVSLNVSSNQFHQVSFVEQIIETLDRYDFPHRCLVLEVTERALLRDTQETRNKIESLKSYGVRISIDDFGTGYSSLAYLKNLSFDEIKLDASFIHD
ncbi:MAG: EAL domain-containing protein, partial [Gammaproteobacteria bacterium]|nr:EAL domain-containing protein [Gammaproteobacteria bacterium]